MPVADSPGPIPTRNSFDAFTEREIVDADGAEVQNSKDLLVTSFVKTRRPSKKRRGKRGLLQARRRLLLKTPEQIGKLQKRRGQFNGQAGHFENGPLKLFYFHFAPSGIGATYLSSIYQ